LGESSSSENGNLRGPRLSESGGGGGSSENLKISRSLGGSSPGKNGNNLKISRNLTGNRNRNGVPVVPVVPVKETLNISRNLNEARNRNRNEVPVRKYIHHHKKGDVIFPGLGLNILKRSVHMLKKKRIKSILGNKRKVFRYKKFYEKRLIRDIRPKRRLKKVFAFK
jgi:hypothetical protein